MDYHIIRETDEDDNHFDWIGVDEDTARALFEGGVLLYFVRDDAAGLIEFDEDLEEAIEFDAVGIEDSYRWKDDFEEEAQNRFRNNDHRSFDEWVIDEINSLL